MKPLYVISLAFGCLASVIYWDINSETRIAERKAEADQKEADKRPRKVNEANGCEVWAFKPTDRWLYFSRCANDKTSTINTWDECRSVNSGKVSRTECTPHSLTITQVPKQRQARSS
jgi:hypothetical protein